MWAFARPLTQPRRVLRTSFGGGGGHSFLSAAFLIGELKPDRGQAPGGHASPDGLAPGGLA